MGSKMSVAARTDFHGLKMSRELSREQIEECTLDDEKKI